MGTVKIYSAIMQAYGLLEFFTSKEVIKSALINLLFFRKAVYAFEKTYTELLQTQPECSQAPEQYVLRNRIYLPQEVQQWNLGALNDSNIKDGICAVLRVVGQENPGIQKLLWVEPEQIPIQEQPLLSLYQLFQQFPICDKEGACDEFAEIFETIMLLFSTSVVSNSGEFYTPQSIVALMVALINPEGGVIYDPCCKNGSMLIAAEQHLAKKNAKHALCGQEQAQEAWTLAQMSLHAFSVQADLGKSPNDIFLKDLHPDLQADYVLTNPPFGSRNWSRDYAIAYSDPRWKYGVPPKNNGDFAWLQHALYHAKSNAKISIVLSVSSLYRDNSSESAIRRGMIHDDIIEAIIALPKGVFFSTKVATAIWILNKAKNAVCKNNILFIDASAHSKATNKIVTLEPDICQKITSNYQAFLNGQTVVQEGFCNIASVDEIASSGYSLMPSRYIPLKEVVHLSESELDDQQKQLQIELRHLALRSATLLDDLLAGE